MHPSQVATIKQRVLRADAGRWSAQIGSVLEADDPEAQNQVIRQTLSVQQARGEDPD